MANPKKKNKRIEKKPVQKQKVEVVAKEIKRPVVRILLKALFAAALVVGVIYHYDSVNRFQSDQKNNHTLKKWDAFYDFTEDNQVDVLLLGNSHLYTGINPKNLSNILGVNSFILASPGTHIGDSYYSLKEALKSCNPKVVVIETFGITDFDPYDLLPAKLSDQFKSFDARRDVNTKLSSTPYLFQIDDYPKAWSTTIRNHNFLFTDYEQIEKNIENEEKTKPKSQSLYLGRYVRFQTGVEDSIEKLYKSKGAPLDGKEYQYSKYADSYIKKIKDLCKENGIKPIFLTLPMYDKHIKNYETWEKRLSEVIDPKKSSWINMQSVKKYEEIGFDATCFENTYGKNQHMTYNGSLLATYHLADFINGLKDVKLKSKKSNEDWLALFSGEEGYFENCTPKGVNENRILLKDHKTSFGQVKEMIVYPDKQNVSLVIKLEKEGLNFTPKKGSKIVFLALVNLNGKDQRMKFEIPFNHYRTPGKDYYFTQLFKAVSFKQIMAFDVIP